MTRPVRTALALLAGAALLYAGVLLALWWGQERLIFQPQPLAPDHDFGLAADVHQVWVDVPGARLHALHLRLPKPRAVVFFLHGNGGNLASWFVNVDFYRRLNVDLFMPDYRGYGKSSGRVRSQAELLDDMRSAWAQVGPAYAGLPVVFYGRSLGTGLAALLAAELPPAQRPALLVLVSPYRHLAALMDEHYPWVPDAVLRYPLRTDQALQALRAPPAAAPDILLLHGTRDTLIPPSHSQALAALPGVRWQAIAGAGHNDLQDFAAYTDAVRQALLATLR